MFLPFLGVTFASLLLMKLGALAAWVAVMAIALKLCIALIVLMAGLLGWNHVKK